ncbi:MAG: hypothetical protein HN791_11150 [Gammaproteobacteria bacterium]|jgi:type IV pilus assembly protein PilW|nr:hypothetical protein [Gammaproteobacteria bacterium]
MMLVKNIKKTLGFTLIELMISMLLGLIVIGGVLSIYISTIQASSDVVKSARLNYDLDSVMQFMINDIRRAGYWGGAVTDSDVSANPFMVGTANINSSTGSCILYTYDFDEDGELDITGGTSDDESEYFGFKLDGDEIKVSAAKTVDGVANCGAVDGRWKIITDSKKVSITQLAFSNANFQCLNTTTDEVFDGSCDAAFSAAGGTVGKLITGNDAVEIRQINITLTGNIVNDADVEKTLTSAVKVRNNRIFTQ